MFGIRFMFIALFCPNETIFYLINFPKAYHDLGFYIVYLAEREGLESEKEREETLQAELDKEAEMRKEEEDMIVDVLLDKSGNLVVDEDGKYVTMRIHSMSTTESPKTSSTPIPLTPPPAQPLDPFNQFTGNFK